MSNATTAGFADAMTVTSHPFARPRPRTDLGKRPSIDVDDDQIRSGLI
jgi:hypothetical protein